jgi:hypothetical protein
MCGSGNWSRKRIASGLWAFFCFALTMAFAAESALAVPAFARRYEVPCHFCHDGFPKLSVIGERFKERGLHMQQETFELGQWLKSVPATLRSGANHTVIENDDDSTSAFFKLITTGALGSRASYWVDQDWVVTEDGFDRLGTDNAWGRAELVPRTMYVKGGRFELDLPFSQERTPYLFQYEIYFANTGFESDTIGLHQDGVEVGGAFDPGIHWSVAIVRGQNASEALELTEKAGRFDGNVYARFQHRSGTNRIGAFAYLGSNVLARQIREGGGSVLVWDDDLLRFGGDGSYYVGDLHLYGVILHGRNDNSIADAANPEGTGETLTFTGGFVQGDYALREEIFLNARLDWIRRPPGQTNQPNRTHYGFFSGMRLGFLNRLRILFELGFRNQGRGFAGAVQAELAL